MPQQQAEIRFPPPPDERDEIAREQRANETVARLMATIIDEEIGRKQLCWALQMSEGELSKRLACVDGKRPCFRMLGYVVRNERAGRMAALLMEQSGHLPPRRPDVLDDKEFRQRAEEAMRATGPLGDALRKLIYGAKAVAAAAGEAGAGLRMVSP